MKSRFWIIVAMPQFRAGTLPLRISLYFPSPIDEARQLVAERNTKWSLTRISIPCSTLDYYGSQYCIKVMGTLNQSARIFE